MRPQARNLVWFVWTAVACLVFLHIVLLFGRFLKLDVF